MTFSVAMHEDLANTCPNNWERWCMHLKYTALRLYVLLRLRGYKPEKAASMMRHQMTVEELVKDPQKFQEEVDQKLIVF